MAGGNRDKYVDNAPKTLLIAESILHQFLPIVLIFLFIYLGVYLFTEVSHSILPIIETTILGYFVTEILLAFALYESKIEFLKDKWVNIILILPFLAAFRALGRIGQALEGLRTIEVARYVPIIETSLLSRTLSQIPTIQKAAHGVVDLPKVAKTPVQTKKLKNVAKSILVAITSIQNKDSIGEQETDSDNE